MVPGVSAVKRVLLALAVVASACSGSVSMTTTVSTAGTEHAAAEYAASALRALEGTAFDTLSAGEIGDLVRGLCEGLGIGAIGVAAADIGLDAPSDEVTILLEVLRTGIEQVCEDRVGVDLAVIYLSTIEAAADAAGAIGVYDEIAAIRAAPAACRALEDGAGAPRALLEIVEVLYGVVVGSVDELVDHLDGGQGVVSGAVLTTATAILCPQYLVEVEALMGDL